VEDNQILSLNILSKIRKVYQINIYSLILIKIFIISKIKLSRDFVLNTRYYINENLKKLKPIIYNSIKEGINWFPTHDVHSFYLLNVIDMEILFDYIKKEKVWP
jgi:hypothetical protein